MSQRNSLFFIVPDKYKYISTNTGSENILFYQHPYNKTGLFVQFTIPQSGKFKLLYITNN